jgi:hypothetical protein
VVRTVGLDDEKLSMLAKWAAGLRDDPRPEVAAAGRAIEMLIDEVERLHVLIWERPLESRAPARSSSLAQIWESRSAAEAEPEGEAPPAEQGDVMLPLRARLRARARTAFRAGPS